MINGHNYIFWHDTRLREKEVDHFFYDLIDMINEIKDKFPKEMSDISAKYGLFEYSLSVEDNAPRIGFKDDT